MKTNERIVSLRAIAPSLIVSRLHTDSENPRSSCQTANRTAGTGFTKESDAAPQIKPIVLVPFDLAPEANESVTLGITMARQMDAQLVLVHAVLLNLNPYGPISLRELKTELCREVIAGAEKVMISAQEQGVTAMLSIEEGSPAVVINRAAARWHPNLIVMSARHHKHIFSRIFRRRTVKKVVSHTNCPVLVVQQKETSHA